MSVLWKGRINLISLASEVLTCVVPSENTHFVQDESQHIINTTGPAINKKKRSRYRLSLKCVHVWVNGCVMTAGRDVRVKSADPLAKSRVSHVGDVWGADVMGSSAEWGVWKLQGSCFLNTPPADSCLFLRFDAVLIYTLSWLACTFGKHHYADRMIITL